MKGQPELQVERAVLQTRREADSLFLPVVNTNTAVMEGRAEREREYVFLWGYLSAEMHGKAPKDRVQRLRLAVLMFLECVITLDAAIAKIATERLNGQPVLFSDCSVKLEEQLQMAEELSEHFNLLARAVGADEINQEELRDSLQSETDRRTSIWLHLARVQALDLFGDEKERHAAMDLLCEPKSAECNSNTA
jgi:hypothetical protein